MRKLYIIILLATLGCKGKLDLKPDSALVIPKSAKDLEHLLEDPEIMNKGVGLSHISADEYYMPSIIDYNLIYSAVVRSAYIWESDLYHGSTKRIEDWKDPYAQVFLANNVIDILAKENIENDNEKKIIKGRALFTRAFAFYNLVTTFAKSYDSKTAATDLGIPLKLSAAVNEVVQRSSLEQSYNQIEKDLIESSALLQTEIVPNKRNLPSKVSAFALLARMYVSMRNYDQAEVYANKALTIYSSLTNYNTLPIRDYSSFPNNSEETIYFAWTPNDYTDITATDGEHYSVATDLYDMYDENDLRKKIYFAKHQNGNIAWKGVNQLYTIPFTGLGTDEMFLIKAECLARKGMKEQALTELNSMVFTRYQTGTFEPVTATSAEDALNKILTERRKALVWRGLRWTDLKRLNLEGRNIILTRMVGDKTYTLEPNSPKYVISIPDYEIQLSGIQQNIR